MEFEDRVVASHHFLCNGACKPDLFRGEIFKNNPKPVVVDVYESGKHAVSCRYVERACRVARCNPSLISGIGIDRPEDDLEACVYSRK